MKRGLITLALLIAGGCGGGPTTGSPSSLTGTWQLAGGGVGSNSAGTLVLTSSRITISIGGGVFDLQTDGTPAFSWINQGGSSTPISATHGGSSVDFGIFPLGLGGDWTFSGAHGGSCSASVAAGSILGSCAGAGSSPSGLPALNRRMTATRTAKLDSVFGELGGSWSVTDDGGGSCTITLQGATVMASCNDTNNGYRRGLSATFGDGVVSGTLDSGAEFSARRQ